MARLFFRFVLPLLSVFFLVGSASDASAQTAPARKCPVGEFPYFAVAVTKVSRDEWNPNSLPPELEESYLSCLKRDPNQGNRIVSNSLIVRHPKPSLKDTSQSVEEFIAKGFKVTKTVKILGINVSTLLTNILICEDCDFAKRMQKLTLNVIHAFKLGARKDSDKQDYRAFTFDLDIGPHVPVLSSEGKVLHVFSFEQSGTGVANARLSACANPSLTVEECLNSPDGNLKTVVDFTLEDDWKRVTFKSIDRN